MDEDLVESVLFCVTGRASRPSLLMRHAVLADGLATLRHARCVSRVWLAAAAKPLIVATLDSQLARFKTAMEFFGARRNGEMTGETRETVSATGHSDRDALRWLIAGWENGFNSIVADEPGLDSIRPCVGVIRHLVQVGVPGPYLVVAPETLWPSWRAALDGLDVSEAHNHVMLDHLVWEQQIQRGVVLAQLHPRLGSSVQLHDDEFSGLQDYRGSMMEVADVCKYVIFDERERLPRVPGLRAPDIFSDDSMVATNFVLITHQPLPSSLEDLQGVLTQLNPLMTEFFSPASIKRALQLCCLGVARYVEMRDWAINAYIVPSIQAALSRVLYLRRLKRGGLPVIVDVEPPKVHALNGWNPMSPNESQ